MNESDDAKAARKRSEEMQEMLRDTLPGGSAGRVKIEAKHRIGLEPASFPGKPETHSTPVDNKQIWPKDIEGFRGPPRWTSKWRTDHPELGYTIFDGDKPIGTVSHGVTKEGVDFMLKLFNKHYGYGENK